LKSKRPIPEQLRERAEARVRSRVANPPADADTLRLVHELEVHQVELELQNEELRETRAALESALERQTELFEFAPVGYLVVDPGGHISEANFAAARLLGVPRGKLRGRHFLSFVVDGDLAAVKDLMGRVLAQGEDDRSAVVLEVGLEAQGGPVLARVSAARADRRVASALLTVEDVTARRRAEAALHDELHRRDDFLATLSHELRNPLAPIRNGLYLLHHAGPEASERALAVIDRQTAHLTRIVDDLLDVTRIARGKLQLKRRVEDLAALVLRTVEDHRDGFEAAGVELEVEVDPMPMWADVDPTRIAQVLGNLLANALKFTSRGGRVAVELRVHPREVALRVRDTGAGIAPDVLQRLFRPFSQGPQGLARTAGGLGLGLATVRGLVDLHGGEVGISSAGAGKGTEVVVRLPRVDVPAERPLSPAPNPATHRVLVIDDNDDAATTLRDVLESCGHAVRTAADARSGLDLAHAFRPEVVLCDIGLPGLDGYTVARAFRSDADEGLRAAYLVALSGYARPEDVQRSLDAGFDRHLAKPASLDRLQALLAEAPLVADAAR
jgi:two-component system CheB/CheR fusion protein